MTLIEEPISTKTQARSFHSQNRKRASSKEEQEAGPQSVEQFYVRLSRATYLGDDPDNVWGRVLCALILALEPDCKLYRVVESLPYGTKATSFGRFEMLETLANLGYGAEVLHNMRPRDIDQRLAPCLYIQGDRPAVLLKGERLYDGQLRPLASKMKRGDVIVLRPYRASDDPTSKLVRAASKQRWFRALFKRFRPALGIILLAGLILNILSLAPPLFIMAVYDRVISTNAVDILPWLAAGVVLAIAGEWALRSLRSRHLSWLACRLDNLVSNKVFRQLVNLPPRMIEGASVQAQIARLKTYEAVRDFFSSPLFLSVIELPFTIIALGVIAVIGGPLVWVPVAFAALYCLLFYFIWDNIRVAIRTAAQASSAKQKYLIETIEKVPAIRGGGLSGVWGRQFRDISGREIQAHFRLNWLGTVGETLSNGLTVLAAVAIIGFGTHLVWGGVITTGGLVASMILVWRVLGPFYSLCTMVPRIDQLRHSLAQVNQLMDLDTETETGRMLGRPRQISGHIRFVNVGMRYDDKADPVFKGLSFDAHPGDIVAVTGENGAGKSTLLKLVKGMYQAQSGSVRLDGFDVRQMDPVDLRRRIAYIPQKPSFFRGTIAENLRFANPLVGMREMEIALDQVCALDEIMALPGGMDTVIGGKDGFKLSSSMELRLSMVRAYLHDAPILLIDELPNSLLTDDVGHFLMENLIRHRKDRTAMIVTYRVDILQEASQVIWLRLYEPPVAGSQDQMMQELRRGRW